MKAKREPKPKPPRKTELPLGLDMDPDEVLRRLLGVKPEELPEAIRQRKGRPKPPQEIDAIDPEEPNERPAN
jgi:hypothetical protein